MWYCSGYSAARRRLRPRFWVVWFSLALGCLTGMAPPPSAAAEKLTVYSGRAERLIKPVLDAFTAKTGVHIDLLSSGTTELLNRLKAEGDRSPADLLITNDAGSLELARTAGLLRPVDLEEVNRVIPSQFRAPDNSWIGLSGRFWIIVYNTTMVRPGQVTSLFDLADPQWKGKIAIPNAGSEYLQAGVSVLRAGVGDERTKQFLIGLRDNAGTQVYQKSSQIVEAVAKGQVAMGIVNHYYVYRHVAVHPSAPLAVVMPDQQEGGLGAVMNVAGVGILKHTPRLEQATQLIKFLVGETGQKMFADLDKEYPLHPGVKADPSLVDRNSFRPAAVPLAKLAELREPTLQLIEQVGLR
ncbi:ABC transporter, periplasmic binding component, Fe3+ transport system [Candidatus Nitrospira inopinata]|uniref:ABC transporter, periplasmic binding component, Fe3+ transport system n=2 Tax=Candidatus Nitrospira inopinata TaxID=1715989 RepID=A0A0S4KUN7_9BACT|nr:ABC transporter, periplasmic binding component, Fe3+ transport system [Candidatus Nitrospira inopinata]